MKKQSQLQKLANLTKVAWSPYAMNPDHGNPISSSSGGSSAPTSYTPSVPSVPKQYPAKLNINVANPNQAGNFNYNNLIKPTTRQFLSQPKTSIGQQNNSIGQQNNRPYRSRSSASRQSYRGHRSGVSNPSYQPNTQQPQPLQHYTVGQYIRQYPPTPAGVPYRMVRPIYDSDGLQDNINAYTDVLNESGLFPEELSSLDTDIAERLLKDISPSDTVYQVDSRDAANWLWSRRGLELTDAQWARANAARQAQNSQLNRMPQTMYYAWSDRDKTNGYSIRFNNDIDENNQFFNVFNPNFFDQPYKYNDQQGFGLQQQQGQLLEPWQRYMWFQDVQDHELSHSFNDTSDPVDDRRWVYDGMNSGWKGNLFFRMTNDPSSPYYNDETVNARIAKFNTIFDNTYLNDIHEYIGAMGRIKRYGAELGYETTSPDPSTARHAMARTLHHFATHPRPEELSPEQQRLYTWLNTAALNHMQYYSQDYIDRANTLNSKSNSEEELRQRYQLKQDTDIDKANYIKDTEAPFYMDVLDFMTDSTIQGLVRNDVPNNNTNALQNLRYGYV